jgi:hypothetical protein
MGWRRLAELPRPRKRTAAAAVDGDGEKEGHSTSKLADTKRGTNNAPFRTLYPHKE